MSKRNHFTDKFEKKTTQELKSVINDDNYQKEAILAALWELDRRGEISEEEQQSSHKIEAEQEQKEARRLSDRKYETFWPRFFASIIDGFVLWSMGFLLNYLLDSDIGFVIIFGSILNNFLPYEYAISLHGKYGQTLGKMVMEVKVVDFEHEEAIDLKQAFKRDMVPVALMTAAYLYTFIASFGAESAGFYSNFLNLVPLFFIGLLSFLWVLLEIFSMLFNEKSRAVHDLIAKTVVIRTT